ncbi:hypothetical protein SERLA73DRAFT_130639 [Serpula lacrymans var. lacrymans S7.3]|uniref:Uncharacterized protein n=1 Tax=Serpula lacrymans var. lacrymans (strain S7.3) TaxID=936435 RepID=F8PLB2_SERL3|nr:hypothetical protein SERLA73DRAFT_130639 [Serpula lacrymans var. lacrymans S7.3]
MSEVLVAENGVELFLVHEIAPTISFWYWYILGHLIRSIVGNVPVILLFNIAPTTRRGRCFGSEAEAGKKGKRERVVCFCDHEDV